MIKKAMLMILFFVFLHDGYGFTKQRYLKELLNADRLNYQSNICQIYAKIPFNKNVIKDFLSRVWRLETRKNSWRITYTERLKLASKSYLVGLKETAHGTRGIGISCQNIVGMKIRNPIYYRWNATRGRLNNAVFQNKFESYMYYAEYKLYGKKDWLVIANSKKHLRKISKELIAISDMKQIHNICMK